MAAAIAVALGSSVGTAHAQEHEQCYRIRDPAKIKGIVDLTTPQFGLAPGCKLGPAKWFCVPAFKSVVSVTSDRVPIAPLPVYAPPAPVDRICYKVRCLALLPPDQNVTDQFGNRTIALLQATRATGEFKTSFLCTPAVKGPAFCGDGVIDPGEDCDAPALGACAVGCEADCTCT
jgi:hypothetical protein